MDAGRHPAGQGVRLFMHALERDGVDRVGCGRRSIVKQCELRAHGLILIMA
jgi:hypothetical protein